MNSKFIVVVVLASVVQGSLALPASSKTDSLLPESALEDFKKILANQELTVISKFNAFNPVFDIFAAYAAQRIYNLTDEVNDAATKINGALAQAKLAVNHSVNSIPIAARASSECLETARTEAHKSLDDAYAAISEAFASAPSANYTEIEKFRIQAQGNMADLVESIYGCIRTSLNTTSGDVLDVTRAAERGSGLGLVHVVNALVNAIKAIAAETATGNANASLIIEIEGFRVAALNGLRADVENKFSGLKTLFINSHLEQSGLVSALARNQYANTVSGYRYVTGFEVMFSVIKTLARNAVLGFSDAGTDDLTAEEIALAMTIAKWDAATRQILMSVKSESTSVWKKLSQMSREAATADYNAIKIAKKQSLNSSVNEAEIKTLIDSALSQTIQYVKTIFNLLRSEKTLTKTVTMELKTLQEAAIDQLRIGASSLYKADIILANSSSNTADLTAAEESIDTLQSQVTASAQKFADIVEYAGIKVLQATNVQ